MYQQRNARAALILIGASFVLMAAASFLSAQTPSAARGNARLDFYGAIQSGNRSAISINGQIIDITSAQINAPLRMGSVVKVQAFLRGSELTASRIDPVGVGIIPGVALLTGVIGQKSSALMTINDQPIDIQNAAQIDSVNVGDSASALVVASAPGRWTAMIIGRPDSPAFAALTAEMAISPPASTPAANAPLPVMTPELTILPPVSTLEVSDDAGGHRDSDGSDDADNDDAGSDDNNDDDSY